MRYGPGSEAAEVGSESPSAPAPLLLPLPLSWSACGCAAVAAAAQGWEALGLPEVWLRKLFCPLPPVGFRACTGLGGICRTGKGSGRIRLHFQCLKCHVK